MHQKRAIDQGGPVKGTMQVGYAVDRSRAARASHR
jgi:hypothetical protein